MKTIAALLLLSLVGCSSAPVSLATADRVPADRIVARAKPAAGLLPIVVTRDSGFIGSACSTTIYVDGDVAAYVRQGEAVTLYVPPGPLILGAEPTGICIGGLIETETNIVANRPARFRVAIDSNGTMTLQRSAAR